ncbi:polysaccharide pyruvyl transferase family protein [Mycolicibacterium litorale]|uniref:polysaccharide pyruvyl transferase family protein n=1 Tax=Mycolicibacterium litorale TaxID=758802 RepID=UPI003CEC1B9C
MLWAKHTATNLGIRVLASGAARLCEMAFEDVKVDFHDHDTVGTPLGKDAILRDIGRSHGEVKSLFRNYDVIVDTTSGDSFTDIYSPRRLTVMAYAHRAALKAGVPLVLAPQTIGPFNTHYGRVLARASIRGATRVYARDSESVRYAAALGRRPDALSSDLVFALPPLPKAAMRSGVYLNVSGLLWRSNPHVDHSVYRHAVLEASRAISAMGHQLTLFPHVLRTTVSREDDVTAVEEAAEALNGEVSVFIPQSLEDVRSHLNSAAVVIGARMHACLNALSVGTPALAWAYSRKFAPLLEDLDWSASVDLRSSGDVVEQTTAFIEDLDRWTMRAPSVRLRAVESIERVARDLAEAV